MNLTYKGAVHICIKKLIFRQEEKGSQGTHNSITWGKERRTGTESGRVGCSI